MSVFHITLISETARVLNFKLNGCLSDILIFLELNVSLPLQDISQYHVDPSVTGILCN